MKLNQKYKVIGLMSGTSLDGLDIAFCEFEFKQRWRFNIREAQTFSYSSAWKKNLSTAHQIDALSLLQLHTDYGRFMGDQCGRFIKAHKIKGINFIASHGHTVFHQPDKKFTFQLGHGAALHDATGLPVVFDFRSLDVARGGEGAPLVPVGDKFLFSQYDVCLNLGGIANLSMDVKGQRRAFDICFCNMAMNYLMNQVGKAFDNRGKLASSGRVDQDLRENIRVLYAGYRKKRPSLAREMFESSFRRFLNDPGIPLADKLHTICESVAEEVSVAIPSSKKKLKLLATGGGVFNDFLVIALKRKLGAKAEVVVPPTSIIEFKEALVFAFLGILRVRNEINVLKSVTKAREDSCSGALIGRF